MARSTDIERGGGFFYALRNHLQTEYSGRFLSLILAELGRREPTAFLAFLDRNGAGGALNTDDRKIIARGEAQYDLEHSYRRGRRADLTVLSRGQPVILVEIKDRDLDKPGSPMQLADYLDHVLSPGGSSIFVHLSRDTPQLNRARLDAAIATGKAFDARFRHLLEAMNTLQQQPNAGALSGMVKDYLEDIGVEAYQTINLKTEETSLTFLIVQMAGFGTFHGLGRLQSAAASRRGPKLLGDLLGNAGVLGDWLHEPNRGCMGNRPSVRFEVRRGYDRRQAVSAISAGELGEPVVVPNDAVRTGMLDVYAQAKLKEPGGWLYLHIGYVLKVDRSLSRRVQVCLFASANWAGSSVEEETEWLDAFPSEVDATRQMAELVRKTLGRARKLAPQYGKTLASVAIPRPQG